MIIHHQNNLSAYAGGHTFYTVGIFRHPNTAVSITTGAGPTATDADPSWVHGLTRSVTRPLSRPLTEQNNVKE